MSQASVLTVVGPPRAWIAVGPGDIQRMVDRLFLNVRDRSRSLSGFWVLLLLSAVISTAGVVADPRRPSSAR